MRENLIKFISLMLLFTVIGCEKNDEIPALSRTTVKSAGPDFVELQGRLYLTGSAPIQRGGACWVLKTTVAEDLKDLQYATIDDNIHECEIKEPGSINMRLTGLIPDTVYYIRFFAENSAGISYSYPVRVRTNKQFDAKSFIEFGKFNMGSAAGSTDEMPIHEVEFKRSFYLSKQEVTNGEYCVFLNQQKVEEDGKMNGRLLIDLNGESVGIEYRDSFVVKNGYENKPVVFVSWYGADAYCRANGGRLPSEAEWEYAAKGGANKDAFFYAGSDTWANVAWFDQKNVSAGKQKQPNTIDLYDMSGNVAEWCADWYAEDYYESSGSLDPLGPNTGTEKVVRGGSIFTLPVSVSARDKMDPEKCVANIGFRLLN